MLGIDRKAARYVWTAALVLLLLYLVFLARKTLFVFILALLFAYLLSPLVNLLDHCLPTNRTRTLALSLAYVIFVGAVVLIGIQIGSRVVQQADALVKGFPDMMLHWEQPIQGAPDEVNSVKDRIVEGIRQEVVSRSGEILSALPQAGAKFLTVASDLIYLVIIPILAFFFLKDGHIIREHILGLVESAPQRLLVDDLMADIHLLLAHYMRALVLLSLATLTSYSIFFSVVGVPYGILLAAMACLLEFIPMIGPLSAGVMIVLVAAMSGSHVLLVLIFLLAYRLFQDYVLSPNLMGQGVELHPLVVLFGAFAGAEVAGIPGTFLSVPVLALVRVLYLRMRKSRVVGRPSPPDVSI
ncbi:MAG TPA: AI-2E family transporter [Bryobacteraceae bacterium]|nr:AI-2E family transporter [Bryobacteraceae bacterium]